MAAQEQNLCMINMPELGLDRILSNIHNPSNVSRTCKYLYEIVGGMEKRWRVMYIGVSDAKSPLNIDTDAVFESILNSHRTIKEIELRVDRFNNRNDPSYWLNERQSDRITAIMKQFGANVTSLKLIKFDLPINFILELLQQTPKLESLSITYAKGIGSVTENTTMSLQLPSLKELEIDHFPGLLDIVNLIPEGSLNSVRYSDDTTEATGVLTAILAKQQNIKSLDLEIYSNADLTAICLDHLQLESLRFTSWTYAFDNNSQFLDILKCQTNLKEFKFLSFGFGMSRSVFQWICNNLKKLEVFEVLELDSSTGGNVFQLLGQLKQLRHFRTKVANDLFRNGLQSFQSFKSNPIEKFEIAIKPEFSCGELLTKMVKSMGRNLPNLTHLKMKFENFSALCFVLGHCKKIIHLTGYISDPNPDQLTHQRFPNIETMELFNYDKYVIEYDKLTEIFSKIMTWIVRAMPNLKSMSLAIRSGLKFDVKTMNEFIKESKSLEYLYVEWLELHRELSTDDVVEIMRCLTDQLKGYHINVSASPEDLNWHKYKSIFTNALYVRDNYWNRSLPCFYLYKGGRKFRSTYF